MFYWVGYFFWLLVSTIFFPIHPIGRENLPRKGAFILASNHESNLDPMIVGLCCSVRLSYMAKNSLFKNKFFAFVLHHVGAFPVKRDKSDVGAIKEAMKRLKAGCSLLLFPEGTRKKNTAVSEPYPGIGLIAVKSALPVIPVHINGSQEVLPHGSVFPRRHRVTVIFGKPCKFSPDASYHEISQMIMRDIQNLVYSL